MEGLETVGEWLRQQLNSFSWLDPLQPTINRLPDWALVAAGGTVVATLMLAIVVLVTRMRPRPRRPEDNRGTSDPEAVVDHQHDPANSDNRSAPGASPLGVSAFPNAAELQSVAVEALNAARNAGSGKAAAKAAMSKASAWVDKARAAFDALPDLHRGDLGLALRTRALVAQSIERADLAKSDFTDCIGLGRAVLDRLSDGERSAVESRVLGSYMTSLWGLANIELKAGRAKEALILCEEYDLRRQGLQDADDSLSADDGMKLKVHGGALISLGKSKEEVRSILMEAQLAGMMDKLRGLANLDPTAAAPADEAQTRFAVILKDAGNKKLDVAKVFRAVVPSLSLTEAKELVDAAPKSVKEGVSNEEAEIIKKKLEEAGAKVEVNVWVSAMALDVQSDQLRALRERASGGDAVAQFELGVVHANRDGVSEDGAEAARWFRLAAEQGHTDAQYNLGCLYSNGTGVPQDDVEAMRWFRLAAEQGMAEAQFNMGCAYYDGIGLRQDDAEAVRWHRLSAEQGHASAQQNLGSMYAQGRGVAQDDVEAVRWYRLGAEQGHASSQFSLGASYATGLGVPQDGEQAVHWYRLAAEQGEAEAQLRLGASYLSGEGVARDETEGRRWLHLAADQGQEQAQALLGAQSIAEGGPPTEYSEVTLRMLAEEGEAEDQFKLGVMYQEGRGVAQNNAKAISLFRLAADRGSAEAQMLLGTMYYEGEGVAQNYVEAARLTRLAAEQGRALAQGSMGVFYANGEGVAQNYAEAVRWYRLAADQGDALAQLNLGLLYDNGEGLAQNDAEAVRWYRLAADQGYANAQYNLGAMYESGQGVALDFVQAYKWFALAAANGQSAGDENRDQLRGEMTPEQIAEAEAQVAAWKPNS